MNNWQIYRKEGFILNPNDKIVNGILKALVRTKGLCPCVHEKVECLEDIKCPCKEYREKGHCRCNLYIKDKCLYLKEGYCTKSENGKGKCLVTKCD